MFPEVFRLTALLLAIGLSISFVEQLANRRRMRDDGILSWRILRLARGGGGEAVAGRGLVDVVMDHPGILVVLVLHGMALVTMIAGVVAGTFLPAVQAAVLATLLLTHYRNGYALEGADQMMVIVAAALFFYSLAPGDPLVAKAALWFIGLQAVLAYFAAGLGKLFSPAWRSGEGLRQVVNTEMYGCEWMARVLHGRPRLARIMSWNVIVFQALFPLALVLGPAATALFLAWGLAFHAGSAVVMGLHRFLWAFLASYPAIWFCAQTIQASIPS